MKVSFDQFYTNPDVAMNLYRTLQINLDLHVYDLFVEPSVGTGAFYYLMPDEKRMGFDIDPSIKDAIKCDFLDHKMDRKIKNIISIGNPPYGKRSKLAIEFVNKCMGFSDVIAMVLPISFMKYNTQRKINNRFGVIYEEILPKNSFIANGKPYNVNTVWQIWKRDQGTRKRKPKTSHVDFTMYLYNNTLTARKFFDYEWNFAVPRQGYQDYNRRETDSTKCETTKQWIFFSVDDEKVLEVLKNIDYNKLSMKNTSIPGFGKADIVEEYESIVGSNESNLLKYL
jgi:hypothetical protein